MISLSWWQTRSRWLDIEWYRYLLRVPTKNEGDRPLGWSYNNHTFDYLSRIWCRLRGHPNGQVFYNPDGYEPDDHCVDCGDEI